VLEDSPGQRIAHVHGVTYQGRGWRNSIALRDRLRTDPVVRADYEQVQRCLARAFPHDRRACTAGKELPAFRPQRPA